VCHLRLISRDVAAAEIGYTLKDALRSIGGPSGREGSFGD
jgi:hypothetical protein